jgi:hypothetical protein
MNKSFTQRAGLGAKIISGIPDGERFLALHQTSSEAYEGMKYWGKVWHDLGDICFIRCREVTVLLSMTYNDVQIVGTKTHYCQMWAVTKCEGQETKQNFTDVTTVENSAIGIDRGRRLRSFLGRVFVDWLAYVLCALAVCVYIMLAMMLYLKP